VKPNGDFTLRDTV